MNNLPEKKQETALTVATLLSAPSGAKAVEVRRVMTQIPEVAKALSPVEKMVFAASTKTQICDIPDNVLVEKVGSLLRNIAIDVGYTLPDRNDWGYICTRLMDYFKNYFSQLTLAEIKLSFELLSTGELDEYLPHDKGGNAERKHYQQFNIEYFGRVLNAYKRKQCGVIGKAFIALPPPDKEPSETKSFRNRVRWVTVYSFLHYKYLGRLPELSDVWIMLVYECLDRVGLAVPVEITANDKQAAFNNVMQRIARGFVNQYTAHHIRKQGVEHEDVAGGAFWIARANALNATFEMMQKKEVQLIKYLKYE